MGEMELLVLRAKAEQVFNDKQKAAAWLSQPKTAFGGITPLEFASSEAGHVSVTDALERIDQGYAF